MASSQSHLLAHRQFRKGSPRKLKKDPSPEEEPKFSVGQGSKTMTLDKPGGLPAPKKKHPHRNHAGARSRRAR